MELVVMAFLLAWSAFFSASETSLFSLARHHVRRFQQETDVSARSIVSLLEKRRALLVSVLLGNMFVNVLYSSLAVLFGARLHLVHGPRAFILADVVFLSVLVIFGEVLPKSVAVNFPVSVARLCAPVLLGFRDAISPLRKVLETVVSLLTRAVVWGGADPPVSREDLSNLLEIGTDYELLSAWEKRLLGEVIELSSIEAREVMTARVAAALYDVDKGREGLINLICESRHSKVPVWRADPDNIIGVVYSKDAFLLPERPLESLVRPVLFFPETAKIDYILRTMLSKERTIAMVVDEYGAIEGVVALEDIAEEIVGEIADEYDSPRPRVIRLSQDRYLLSADVTLREWNEMAGSALEDERVETLGGLVAAQLDRLPRKDDSVIAAGYRFTVQRVVNDRLKILLAQKAHAGRRRAGE